MFIKNVHDRCLKHYSEIYSLPYLQSFHIRFIFLSWISNTISNILQIVSFFLHFFKIRVQKIMEKCFHILQMFEKKIHVYAFFHWLFFNRFIFCVILTISVILIFPKEIISPKFFMIWRNFIILQFLERIIIRMVMLINGIISFSVIGT